MWRLPGRTRHLAHPLKIRNGLIVFRQQKPDAPTPFIDGQKLRRLDGRGHPLADLQRLRVERNGFLVGIRLAGFVPRLCQVVKRFLPDGTQGEMMRQFLRVLRQPVRIQPFHRMTGCGMEPLSPGGEQTVVGHILCQSMFEDVDWAPAMPGRSYRNSKSLQFQQHRF